jgi:ubiquinone/menaquinone biosynthesis C-methylase UbiE
VDVEGIRRGYDTVARAYADGLADELDHKPFDRARLDRFAALAAGGRVCDLGCGPGQVAGHLPARGLDVWGADISEEMLRQARRLHPSIEFRREDMLRLGLDDGSLGGIVAFYAIVNFRADQVDQALRECRRVLAPGGHLLLAFHIGDETRHLDQFLDHPVSMDFSFFQPDDIVARLEGAGLAVAEVTIRDPYRDVEYPSRRAYILARG